MFGKIAKAVFAIALLLGAAIVAIAEFPNQVGKLIPALAQLLPPPLPKLAPVKAAHWLDQNWSTEDRHWFHHASQGTATFPVPYAWFMALEQSGLHLVTRPGMLSDPRYLERFGFIPSPKTIRADAETLRRFGYVDTGAKTTPAPETVAGLRPTPVENFDGLPVGFSRMNPVINPGTGKPDADRIGLTCAACHTGSIRYKDVNLRFDGGAAMLELRKLEQATGLSVVYTLYVPGRFDRFATRVLGAEASKEERDTLKQGLKRVGDFLKGQIDIAHNREKATGLKDTAEGYGRLDALNRIGNQVFYTDLVAGGLSGFESNWHANDAPVSYPPVWTVPWFWWAQYDASIEQPLIRNAGEALGVFALVNLSPDHPPEKLFSSSVDWKISCASKMLRGPDPFGRKPKDFGGLTRRNGRRICFPAITPGRSSPTASQRAARFTPISARVSSRPGQRSPVRQPVSGQEFLVFQALEPGSERRLVLNEVQKGRGYGHRPGASPRPEVA